MSCAWQHKNCRIGVILDSGTNTCYIEVHICSSLSDQIKTFVQDIEKVKVWTGDTDEPKHVIINTEWGAFGDDGELEIIKTR